MTFAATCIYTYIHTYFLIRSTYIRQSLSWKMDKAWTEIPKEPNLTQYLSNVKFKLVCYRNLWKSVYKENDYEVIIFLFKTYCLQYNTIHDPNTYLCEQNHLIKEITTNFFSLLYEFVETSCRLIIFLIAWVISTLKFSLFISFCINLRWKQKHFVMFLVKTIWVCGETFLRQQLFWAFIPIKFL